MKKTLFAIAAIGAFAGAAQAQSSVSVYGIYDGAYNSINTSETTAAGVKVNTQAAGFTGSESASSRIGFRGVEDLGGGKSINFNLELGFNAGTGEVTVQTSANGSNTTGANSLTCIAHSRKIEALGSITVTKVPMYNNAGFNRSGSGNQSAKSKVAVPPITNS